ncbi:MAG TPA: hypothetical protein VF812_18225 [Ktedonobacterales bacterium]
MAPILGDIYAMQCVLAAGYLTIVMLRVRRQLPWRAHVLAFLVSDALFTCGFIFLLGVIGPTHRALSDWAVQLIPRSGCYTPGVQAFIAQRDHLLEALYFPAGLMVILGPLLPAALPLLATTYGQRHRWLRRA